MKYRATLLALCLATSATAALPERLLAESVELPKRADFDYAAYRLIPVFGIALYAPESIDNPYPFLADTPIGLSFRYDRSIRKEDFIAAGDAALADFLQPAALAALAPQLAILNAAYDDVEKGDTYTLLYQPGLGTQLLQGDTLKTTIPGHEFALAYFGIWLAEHPRNKRLRQALLTP